MQRKPLERRTPLGRTLGLAQGKGLRPMSNKAQRRAQRRRAVVDALRVRRPWCEVGWEGCTRRSIDAHEPEMRSRSGEGARQGDLILDPLRIVMCCRPCHDLVHANPRRAEAAGLLIPSGPVPKVRPQEPSDARL